MGRNNVANNNSATWLAGHVGSRVRTELRDRLLVITLDNSPVNSLDSTTYQELFEVFSGLSSEHDLAAALLLADNRCFSAGQDRRDIPSSQSDMVTYLHSAANALVATTLCPIPLVVAVKSAAVGAGLILASCADVLVLDTEATLSLPERNFGVVAGYAHLSKWISPGGAAVATLTGEPINPRAFIHGGAIIVASAEVDVEAERLARSIAQNDSALTRSIKSEWLESRRAVARDYMAEIDNTITLGLVNFSLPMSPEK